MSEPNYEAMWADLRKAVDQVAYKMGDEQRFTEAKQIVRAFSEILEEVERTQYTAEQMWDKATMALWTMRFVHCSMWTQALFMPIRGRRKLGWDVLDSLEDLMDGIRKARMPIEAVVVQSIATEENHAEAGGDP